MIVKNKVLKSFISLSFAEFISKLFGFITLAYLARVISPESFGIVAFVTAFVAYFLLFVELGFDTIVVKKIAQDHSLINKYVNNIISVKLINALVLFLLVIVFTLFLEKSTIIKTCIIIYALMLFVHAGSLDFLFQSVEQFRLISYKIVGKSALYLVLVLLFVQNDIDIYKILFFIVLSASVFTVWHFFQYSKQFDRFKFEFDKKFLKILFSESYPLLISVIMATIYGNLDIIMLGFMKTDYEVGIYNAAYKLFLIAVIPYSIIVKIYLPKLSQSIDINELKRNFMSYIYILILCGLILMSALFTYSDYLLENVFGINYIGSSNTLKILSSNGLIVCFGYALGIPLTVWGWQKYHAIILTIGAISNVSLNTYLISTYSFNGAAFATLISELVVLIGFSIIFVNKKILST